MHYSVHLNVLKQQLETFGHKIENAYITTNALNRNPYF